MIVCDLPVPNVPYKNTFGFDPSLFDKSPDVLLRDLPTFGSFGDCHSGTTGGNILTMSRIENGNIRS